MTETPLEVRPLWSVYDLARRLQVSRITVYRWIDRGEVDAVKVGGVVRILPEEVDRLLAPTRQENDS